MKQKWLLLIPILVSAVSCRYLDVGGPSGEELAGVADRPLTPEVVRRMVSGDPEASAAADQAAVKAAQGEAARRAVTQVESRMILPETYGRTMVISPDTDPARMPTGPMEELVGRKVSMRLQNANIQDLVLALSEIDGLNILADEALTADQSLTISVTDVPLHEILTYIARNMGIAFYVGETTIWVTAGEDDIGGPRMETRIYRLHNGTIPALGAGEEDVELFSALEDLLTGEPGSNVLRVFPNRNLLVVRETRENLRLVEEILAEFDREPAQVLIEARFLTISKEDLSELGVDIQQLALEAKDPDVSSAILTFLGSSTFAPFAETASGLNTTTTGILGNHEYTVLLHALQRTGKVRTLSAPRVTVLNNQSARIRRGGKLYYFEEFDIESSGGDNPATRLVPTGSPTELELGITFEVKVNVGRDGRIMLALAPEIVEFDGWENFETSGDTGTDDGTDDGTAETGLARLPRVNENLVETSVVVDSGETVVLGGMISNSKQRTVDKVPILGDVPLIGHLFRHTTESDTPQHLIIFVKATLVGAGGELIEVRRSDTGNTP